MARTFRAIPAAQIDLHHDPAAQPRAARGPAVQAAAARIGRPRLDAHVGGHRPFALLHRDDSRLRHRLAARFERASAGSYPAISHTPLAAPSGLSLVAQTP